MSVTDTTIRRVIAVARASGADQAIRDDRVRGLELRVQGGSGTASWSVRANVKGGQRVRVDLGEYPALGLAKARQEAEEKKVTARKGIDPRPQPAPRPVLTLKQAVAKFHDDSTKRSRDQEKRRFELHVLGFEKLAERDVATIERKDVARVLANVRNTKGLPAEANRVRASLSALFNWLIQEGEVDHNPVAGTQKATEPSLKRQQEGTARTLSLDELAAIWRAAEADSSVNVSALLRLLLLVPLRRQEWTEARWGEVTTEGERTLLSIPADRMKGKRPHTLLLPPTAASILSTMPRVGDAGWIFTDKGNKAFAGWRRAAARISKAADLAAPWTVHDIRRGVATAMGEAGIAESTIGRTLAHSTRTMMGVTATYERSQRLEETGAALRRWENVLLASVAKSQVAGNVVPIMKAG
jgi:integrase